MMKRNNRVRFHKRKFEIQIETCRTSALDENGKEFDRFSIDPQGKVTELFQSPELKHFSLNRK